MADPAFAGTIETVRGRLGDERAAQLLRFWSERGALEGEAAQARLGEVVCVVLDDAGEIAGVNSPEMINAAFAALEEELAADAEGAGAEGAGGEKPVGLCVVVSDRSEMERRSEAVWPETELMFAG